MPSDVSRLPYLDFPSSQLTCPTDYTETGIGVKQDVESAKRWYLRAAGTSIDYHPI